MDGGEGRGARRGGARRPNAAAGAADAKRPAPLNAAGDDKGDRADPTYARTGRIADDPMRPDAQEARDARDRPSGGDAAYLTIGEPPRRTPWRPTPDRTWPGRGSITLTVLAIAMAAYMAGAAFYAVDHAARFADLAAFPLAAAALAVLALGSQVRLSEGIAIVLVISFLAQLNWASLAEPQPIDDLARLWDLSQRFAAGLAAGGVDWTILESAPSPAALVVYALASLAFGDDLSVLRAAAAGLWTTQTWLVWRIAREISEIRERATIVALFFGLAPTTIVFGALPSVEAVFGVFALSAVYMLLSHRLRGLLLSAALAGVFAALAFLTRPIGAAVLVGLAGALLLGLVAVRGWRARLPILGAVGCLALGFAIGVAPQFALNMARGGVASIAAGPAVGYQLLIGSNQDAGGRYSDAASTADLRRAGLRGAETPPIWEANRRAIEIATSRITSDPAAFAVFAATEKMRRLWASEREMLVLSLSAVSPADARATASGAIAPTGAPGGFGAPPAVSAPPLSGGLPGLLLDAAYLAFLIAAAIGAARLALSRGRLAKDPTRWVMVYGAVAAMALTLLLFEARPRQHIALTPLLALTTPLAFAGRRRARAIKPPKLLTLRVRDADARPRGSTPVDVTTPISEQPAEARLAHVLARMSKPPREREAAAPAEDAPLEADDDPGAQDLLSPSARYDAAPRRRPDASDAPGPQGRRRKRAG